MIENFKYLNKQIITYIGNKRKLINNIESHIKIVKERLNSQKLKTCDLFSGSGIIARLFKQHSDYILVNDLEYYSKIINECYIKSNLSDLNDSFLYHMSNLKDIIGNKDYITDGIISTNYAPKDDLDISKNERVFYTRENALILDTAMKYIHDIGDYNIKCLLLGPLLYQASVHTNTSGIFKGFHKNEFGIGHFGGRGENALDRIKGRIKIETPYLSNFECGCDIKQELSENLFDNNSYDLDLTYIDPPYNQHPYGSNYFMLNTIAKNELGENLSKVSGIPSDWNRSVYNKKDTARDALFDVIDKCPSKFVLISYNSEGFIDKSDIISFLNNKGELHTSYIDYSTYKGSRNLNNRNLKVKEYLFLLER